MIKLAKHKFCQILKGPIAFFVEVTSVGSNLHIFMSVLLVILVARRKKIHALAYLQAFEKMEILPRKI